MQIFFKFALLTSADSRSSRARLVIRIADGEFGCIARVGAVVAYLRVRRRNFVARGILPGENCKVSWIPLESSGKKRDKSWPIRDVRLRDIARTYPDNRNSES